MDQMTVGTIGALARKMRTTPSAIIDGVEYVIKERSRVNVERESD